MSPTPYEPAVGIKLSCPQESIVEESWPLVIPPILTLLDDEDMEYKVKGTRLLLDLIQITPSPLLNRTGLGEVFTDAMIPNLLYLPTLTPEGQSLEILTYTYSALIALIRTRFPGESQSTERLRLLDRVLREGIIQGYSTAGENVKIAELLMLKLSDLVNEMGIWSAKHLKVLLAWCVRR